MNTDTNYRYPIARQMLRRGVLLFGCLALLGSTAAFGQAGGTGAVSGSVRNSGTDAFLEGAEVSLVGTALSTLTRRDGSFTLANVPAGNYRLRVFYTGLDAKETPIDVKSGDTAVVPVSLAADVYRLDVFTVAGEREGSAAAITRQRTALNIMNVVSTDAFGDVADGNLANFMQLLPSVAAFKQSGDLVGISVRGTPAELNSVMLDGTRFASAIAGSTAGLGDRTQFVDRIPAEFIKEIAVTKGSTPDQPADSLGGSINMITKSAFDFKNRVVTYRAGVTYNDNRRDFKKYVPTGAMTFLDTFGKDRQFGVALSGSYSRTINPYETVLMAHSDPDMRNAQARELNDVAERVRVGFSGKLEYRLDNTLRLGVNAALNYYAFNDDRVNWQASAGGSRRIADYNVVSRAQILAGATPLDSTRQVAGIAPGFTNTFSEMLSPSINNSVATENRRAHQYKVGVDGEKTWGDSKLTIVASYNPSSFDNNYYGINITRTPASGISIDTSKASNRPVFAQTYGPTIGAGADFTQYVAARFEQPDITREEVGDIRADYLKKFSNLAVPLNLKTGVDYRNTHRWLINTYRPQWLFTGADRVQGRNAATGANDDNVAQFLDPSVNYSIFNNAMWKWDTFDAKKVETSFRASPEYWLPSGTTVATKPIPRIISEGVSSAYVQGDLQVGSLNFLGGVRVEHTAVHGVSQNTDPRNLTNTIVSVNRSYDKYFPSLHLRYNATRNLLFRASFSTGSARPSISNMLPTTTISYLTDGTGLGTVRQNNPGIRPNYAQTYDFSIEYYFEPAGVLSAGVFHKDIKDFINTETRLIGSGPNNGFGGLYENFVFTTSNNLGSAVVKGLEANYNQQFRNLPKPFNGLSAFANYTRLDTTGQYANGASQLAQFTPWTYNAGVSYTWGKLTTRLSYRRKSAYLASYSATPWSSTYIDELKEVDVNLEFKLRPSLSFFLDISNLHDDGYDQYSLNMSRVNSAADPGRRMNAGISGRF